MCVCLSGNKRALEQPTAADMTGNDRLWGFLSNLKSSKAQIATPLTSSPTLRCVHH